MECLPAGKYRVGFHKDGPQTTGHPWQIARHKSYIVYIVNNATGHLNRLLVISFFCIAVLLFFFLPPFSAASDEALRFHRTRGLDRYAIECCQHRWRHGSGIHGSHGNAVQGQAGYDAAPTESWRFHFSRSDRGRSRSERQSAVPDYWLENVKITGHAPQPPAVGANAMHLPSPGDEVPDFSFTNQDGKPISLHQYRGKILFITFIYTRCPFPDFCPRMSQRFAEIYQQLGSNPSLATAQLLSVSFDPEHDTPKVLRDYGFSVAHTHDAALFRRWQLPRRKLRSFRKLPTFSR